MSIARFKPLFTRNSTAKIFKTCHLPVIKNFENKSITSLSPPIQTKHINQSREMSFLPGYLCGLGFGFALGWSLGGLQETLSEKTNVAYREGYEKGIKDQPESQLAPTKPTSTHTPSKFKMKPAGMPKNKNAGDATKESASTTVSFNK